MFWARIALCLALLASPALAQTNPGFVTGAILCANTGDVACQNVTPANPLGLNQALISKMDYLVGSPLAPVTQLQQPFFGSASLASIFVNGTAASTTLPEWGIQVILNNGIGSTNASTAFKGAIFGACSAGASAADCYGGNFVASLAAGTPATSQGIALEGDVNCFNANYGDAAGTPAQPYCTPFYVAEGPTSLRSNAMIMVNVSGPTNRGLVFFTANAKTIRLNVIEDYSTVSIGGFINAAGSYAGPAAIDLNAATISNAALRIPNNKAISWRNAANSADIAAIRLNGSNQIAAAAPVAITATAQSTGETLSNGTNFISTLVGLTAANDGGHFNLLTAGVAAIQLSANNGVASFIDNGTIGDGLSIGTISAAGAKNLLVAGAATIQTLPTSAGGGGVNVCVDSTGVLYKKAACP